jgi:5-formyltetrahydrofolate cyclo-ligase
VQALEENSEKKSSLRKLLLRKRDSISDDYMTIASKQIQRNLKKISAYVEAKTVAAYYSTGSEVKTGRIIQEMLAAGKTVALPRVESKDIVFCKVNGFEDLEKGEFDIMEPKMTCPKVEKFDVILVPAIAMTQDGQRLGYGKGFYDRLLSHTHSVTIALTYSKLIVKNIPKTASDVPIQWIVTEDGVVNTL